MGYHGSLTLKAYKDFVGIKFENSTKEDFDDSVGLMGSFGEGFHLARDGATVLGDNNAFGSEWQVREGNPFLFEIKARPRECTLPSSHLKNQRRLGETIGQEEAEFACAEHKQGFEQCVYDVIATGDLGVATSGAFCGQQA